MKNCLLGLGLIVGVLLLMRSRPGTRTGNQIRALTDEMMLGFLRLTSEFESELKQSAARPAA